MQSVLCSSIWHIGSLNSVPKKVVKNWHFHIFGTVNPKLITINHRKSLLITFPDGGLNIVDLRTKIEFLFVKKKVLQIIKSITQVTFLAVYWLVIHLKEHLVLFRLYLP